MAAVGVTRMTVLPPVPMVPEPAVARATPIVVEEAAETATFRGVPEGVMATLVQATAS